MTRSSDPQRENRRFSRTYLRAVRSLVFDARIGLWIGTEINGEERPFPEDAGGLREVAGVRLPSGGEASGRTEGWPEWGCLRSGSDRATGVDGGQGGERAVMFSYANSEENIREAARRLGEYLGTKAFH